MSIVNSRIIPAWGTRTLQLCFESREWFELLMIRAASGSVERDFDQENARGEDTPEASGTLVSSEN
jgi:hypothetical protein